MGRKMKVIQFDNIEIEAIRVALNIAADELNKKLDRSRDIKKIKVGYYDIEKQKARELKDRFYRMLDFLNKV